ncbi:MAG TPA: response regulator [Anaerolineales bacterium]|nr:response regulator [Anaerolineales bacterium]
MVDSDKIRVLIVDDIAETRENLRKLLQFEKDVEVIGVARSGREAIDQARETKPDVVLMDINMPDMDGITATELIRRNNTVTQIVILSVQGDPNYMRRAMLAGARDFLTKPPAIDELTGAIHRAGKMAHDERMKVSMRLPSGGEAGTTLSPLASQGKIITVYSPKGGAGVTTLAVNLAMTLRNEDTFVTIVDGDLQFGDVAVFLNEQSKTSVVDLGARADELDPEFVDEVMITHAASGVKILAAPDRPEEAESINGEQFAKVLKYLRQMYAYIVIDTDSALNDITLAALDTSDLVILVTTQEIPAIKNCRLFLDLAIAMKLDRRRILFVMNRFDKRIGITPEKVGESFKTPISAILPFDERVVIPSVNRGVPFMLGDRSKPISKGFLSLAEAIRQRLVELSTTPAEALASNGKKFGKR